MRLYPLENKDNFWNLKKYKCRHKIIIYMHIILMSEAGNKIILFV